MILPTSSKDGDDDKKLLARALEQLAGTDNSKQS
jgi:hypothetical protein